MDPSDSDQNELNGGAPGGGDEPTHVNGRLEESDRWLRSVVENSSELVTVVDPDGTLRYANPAFGRTLGYDPGEAVGTMNVLDHVHPDDLAHVLEETEDALARGGVATNKAEYRFRARDGSWRWMESVGTYLLDDPHVGGVVVTSRDATARVRANERLRFQAQLLGAVGEAVVALGAGGGVVYWNRAAEEMFGWSAEEAMGRRLGEMVVPGDLRARAEEAMAEARAGMTWSGELVVRRRDGARFTVEATNTPVLGEDGVPAGAISVLRDVSDRKEAEEALRQSETELFAVLESITDGFFVLDREFRFAFANPQAALLLDRTREDLVGERIWEDDTFYPEYCRALREGRTASFEAYYRPLGKWYDVRAYPSGTGLSVYFQEVTERKGTERALREGEARLAEAQRIGHLGSWEWDLATGEVRWSEETYRILGLEPKRGTSSREVFGEALFFEDRPLDARNIAEALDGRRPYDYEHRIRRPTGEVRWVHSRAEVVRGEGGEPLRMVGTVHDVTERKEAEERIREAEERYRTLVEQIPAVTYIDRADGSSAPVYTSPQIERMLGYTPQEWIGGRLWEKRIHPEDKERILAADERFEKGAERFGEEYRILARDGSVVWVREEALLVRDGEGRPRFWQGVIHDITGRKEVERALRESEERFRGTFENAPIGVALVGLPSPSPASDRRYLKVNRALCEMLGYAEEELLSMSTPDVTHPEDLEKSRTRVERLFEEGGSKYTLEKRYVRSDGRVVWAMLNVSLVRDPEGRPSHFVSQFQDVTARRALEERLEHQALHDHLTGLSNRRLFVDRLGQALGRTRRREGRGVAVLFVDLDDFKSVNDSLGHGAGDLLLVLASERLKGGLRAEDTLARFGGDEFVVLLEDVEEPEGAVMVAGRILEGFERPFALEGRELYVRASIGIALGDARTKAPEDLLRDADTAMYRAKEKGSGHHSVFDPSMHERALGRLELENDLRRAVDRGEFVVHYQPKVRVGEVGEIVEVEALLRWEHPRRGLLQPEEFVPVAEETGLIVPIGRWVLKKTCRQLKEWQDRHPKTPPLAACVNVSAAQLRYPGFLGDVGSALEESGVGASSLALEITESALVKDMEMSMELLGELKALGIRLALDDFGSEYSSLSYLMRLPVDFVKIDKSFVRDLGNDPRAVVIVESMISLAHSLGLETVGEGVESAEQLEILRHKGCDLVQGYHLARPLPGEEVEPLLADREVP